MDDVYRRLFRKALQPLTQINQSNVKHLTLEWTGRIAGGKADNAIVGGEGPDTNSPAGVPRVAGSILQVNGILYFDAPDNAWAMDARSGKVLWHYFWKTKGGSHLGNRGMGMYHDRVYFETPDDYLVCLDAKSGKEIWHKEIADFNQQYYSTFPPVVIGNHLLVGSGNDMDAPGFLKSVDP